MYRILGDPGAVSRVDKMFVVKVYCKIETSPIIEMSFYYPWCPGARLDLTVNFRHEHFIDPTNCPWVSEDACIENWSMRSLGQWIIENKVYLLSMLGQKKKGSRLRLCFWVVHEVPEKNEWICESRYMSSSIKVFVYMYFAGLYLPLKPFCDYSLYSVYILPQPACYSQSVVCILDSVCILPLVRSLQSAVFVLH